MRGKLLGFAAVVPAVLIVDLWTKSWALRELMGQPPRELLGGLLPLTFALNRGAAFGLSFGSDPRWIFVGLTVLALGLLFVLLVQADDADQLRIVSLTLVIAGALGNLWDRLRWSRGVVDFLGPVDLGFWHFPIFNVADVAISFGAVLLAVSFWREEREARQAVVAPSGAPEPESGAG